MTRFTFESLKSWKRVACLIAVIGTLQMIILTLIAMILYPDGYSFSDHYFSHLGLTHTPNGADNSEQSVVFAGAKYSDSLFQTHLGQRWIGSVADETGFVLDVGYLLDFRGSI